MNSPLLWQSIHNSRAIDQEKPTDAGFYRCWKHMIISIQQIRSVERMHNLLIKEIHYQSLMSRFEAAIPSAQRHPLSSSSTAPLTKLYQKIIDFENIKEAYLDVYESFLKKCAVFSYDVIDSQQIHQTEIDLENFLRKIQKELIEGVKPRLARSVSIPKKNGKIRKIYMVPIKERVKCQAIYRVLQEHLKPTYSKLLYSFRSDRPAYYALRSLRRFYLSNVHPTPSSPPTPAPNTTHKNTPTKQYYLLKTDFKDYSDHINKTILLNKLQNMGVDQPTLHLVQQFVEMPFIRKGEIMSMSEGTMQGIPLVSLFNNIYMDQIDQLIGSNVEFYRRVGDDIIALDQDYQKLKQALVYIREQCQKMKIILNEEKTQLQTLEEKFEYLGLAFEQKRVYIPESKVQKMLDQMKLFFPSDSTSSLKSKINRLKKIMVINGKGHSALWGNYIESLNMLTDMAQLQKVSLQFMMILWAYLGQGYTSKKIAAGRLLLLKSGLNLKSFFEHFKTLLWKHQVK